MTDDREQQLDQIIADYLQAQEAGRTIIEADVIAAHPELADELREFFDDLDQLNKIASPLAAPVMSRKPVLGTLRYFGDYELLEEIARGGMGIVYKARQTSLNRIVAVKLILSGHLASETDVKRFQTEAESAANLQHPHIVSVHEVGRHNGQSYFSMDYIDGKNLSELVREHPLPPKQAAGYVREVAEAIQYAHQQGTLHRDLKSSNVLIDQNDRVQITDFGLAFREESDSGLTRTGQVLGTPSYMPPEQAQHKRGLIGPGSDIYSIGAVLYELLTGRPPFQADSAVETLRQVIETEPLSPRLLNPAVPKDLETICLKCLQKEPHKRYATAQQLADDLGRFLQGEPILARPIGRMERAWRWCRRKPAVAGLSFALLLAVLGGFAGVTTQWLRAEKAVDELSTEQTRRTALEGSVDDLETREKSLKDSLNSVRSKLASERSRIGTLQATNEELQELRQDLDRSIGNLKANLVTEQGRSMELEASIQKLEMRRTELNHTLELQRWKLSESYIEAAGAKWKSGDLREGKQLLDLCPEEHRFWRWHFYHKQCFPLVTSQEYDGELSDFTLRDGTIQFIESNNALYLPLLPTSIKDARVQIDLNAWKVSMELDGRERTGSVTTRIMSPDLGKLTLGIRFMWRGASDGRVIFEENYVAVADLESGRLDYLIPFDDLQVIHLGYSADSSKLAVVSAQSGDTPNSFFTSLWSADEGKLIRQLPKQDHPFKKMAFSTNGDFLAISNSENNSVNVWDATYYWEPTRLHVEPGPVFAVALSLDGKLLASGIGNRKSKDSDKTIVVSNLTTGNELLRIQASEKGYCRLQFSPDGRLLAVGAFDGVSVWDLSSCSKVFEFSTSSYGIDFSQDGRQFATSSRDQTIIWDCGNWSRICELNEGANSIAFSPDHEHLALAQWNRWVIWRLGESPHKRFEGELEEHENAWDITFSPNGSLFAMSAWRGTSHIFLYDTATGTLRWKQPVQSALAVTFLDDGRLLAATTDQPGAIKIWDTTTGRERFSLKNPSISNQAKGGGGFTRPWGLAVSPTETFIAAGWGSHHDGTNGSVRLWDFGVDQYSLLTRWARPPTTYTPQWILAEEKLIATYRQRISQPHYSLADFYELAAHLRYTDDIAGYRDVCGKLLEQFSRTETDSHPDDLLRVHLFFPEGKVTSEILEIAKQHAEGDNLINDCMLGLAYYRLGQPQQALAVLKPAAEGGAPPNDKIVSLLGLALVQLQLELRDEASSVIRQARRVHEDSEELYHDSSDRQPWGVIPSLWREVEQQLKTVGLDVSIPELPPVYDLPRAEKLEFKPLATPRPDRNSAGVPSE